MEERLSERLWPHILYGIFLKGLFVGDTTPPCSKGSMPSH